MDKLCRWRKGELYEDNPSFNTRIVEQLIYCCSCNCSWGILFFKLNITVKGTKFWSYTIFVETNMLILRRNKILKRNIYICSSFQNVRTCRRVRKSMQILPVVELNGRRRGGRPAFIAIIAFPALPYFYPVRRPCP